MRAIHLCIAVATLLRTFLAVCFAYCRRCLCPNLCGDGYNYARASGQGAGLDTVVGEMGQRFARKPRKAKAQERTMKSEGATVKQKA